ncbi:MAG: hypothetical protein WC878_08205 [Candidatus Paceibacterota bacterium]|jgi:hypothetical protein
MNGNTQIDFLTAVGVNYTDIGKLKDRGCHTVESLAELTTLQLKAIGIRGRSAYMIMKYSQNIDALIRVNAKAQGISDVENATGIDRSNIIYIDRTVAPNYFCYFKERHTKKILNRELEKTGPAEFDISKLEPWFINKNHKENETMRVGEIYDYLEKHKMLKDCLGMRELEEIKKMGSAFFRKHFKGKTLIGWKAVVCDIWNDHSVLALCESEYEKDVLRFGHYEFCNYCGRENPILFFPN